MYKGNSVHFSAFEKRSWLGSPFWYPTLHPFLQHKFPSFYSLPKDKILDRSMLKAFADNIISVTEKLTICFGKSIKHSAKKKEKMLVTSIFSFSHNVFKRVPIQGRENSGLCSEELNSNTTI